MQQEWLTATELAEVYRIKLGTIRAWVREGAPHLRLGSRLVRFDVTKVEHWLKRRSRAGTQALHTGMTLEGER